MLYNYNLGRNSNPSPVERAQTSTTSKPIYRELCHPDLKIIWNCLILVKTNEGKIKEMDRNLYHEGAMWDVNVQWYSSRVAQEIIIFRAVMKF